MKLRKNDVKHTLKDHIFNAYWGPGLVGGSLNDRIQLQAASSAIAYEITDQENQYPLTLYQWHKENILWSIRLDPANPLVCSKKPMQ